MARVAYEDLNDKQFEALVVEMMTELFGEGVVGFSEGKDGGRDARFDGVANKFPSAQGPWRKITVGQAKHTSALNAHYSDPSFSGLAESSVLTKEIKRLVQLVADGELDNYLLVSNRRLGGQVGPGIIARIAKATGLPKERITLAGVEYMDSFLRRYPKVLERAMIDPIDGPLLVSSVDLAEVILAMADAMAAPISSTDAPVVDRVAYADKNRVNGMSQDFATEIERRYLPYSTKIARFLAAPDNVDTLRRYEATVEDFQLKILAKKRDDQSFDDVFNYLADLLFSRDHVLSSHRSLTRTMIFYMYWHCDIGRSPSATA